MGRFYSWPFAIANVRHPLLGADFLAHRGLLIDVAGKRLIDTGTCRTRLLRAGPGITPISAVVVQPYAALLQEFQDAFKSELRQSPGSPSKYGVYHHINTTGPPTLVKFLRLPPSKTWNGWAYARRRTVLGRLLSTGRAQDRHHKAVQLLHLIINLQPMQRWGHVSTIDEQYPGGPAVLCLLRGRYLNLLQNEKGTLETRPRCAETSSGERFDRVFGDGKLLSSLHHQHRLHPNSPQQHPEGKAKKLVWGPLQQRALDRTKAALTKATTLVYHEDSAPRKLTPDTSNITCDAVLEQIVKGYPQPFTFFSKGLKPAETRYSRELLAVYLAIRHFKYMLEGTTFTIVMDHQPLIHAFMKSSDAWSSRQQRHLAAIAEFGYANLAIEQQNDLEAQDCHTTTSTLQMKDIPFGPAAETILCDTSTRHPRPWIPASCRRKIDAIHRLSHLSSCTTAHLLSEKFI
ncbi:uncharacterized protein [Palaemon carinicauda]|uniref:uncharacterized protein n=1 Tax=Palaemon carinicauda TaxID=392227 RepID=UPI0035B647F1